MAGSEPMMISGWGAASSRGLVRSVNEDSVFAAPPVFVVADGMGGHAAGDVASRLAVERFQPLTGPAPLNVNDSAEAVAEANEAILRMVEGHPDMAGMGTTIAGLVVISAAGAEHWQVFNVGDCRVYRLADGRLSQLTVDHSEAEEMVLAGRITRREARSYPRRNVVTRSLGTVPPPQVDSWVFPPSPPERFLVCSDGLTTELDDHEIELALVAESEPQAAADRLVALAVEAGGRDNVTTVVVDGLRTPHGGDADEDTVPREVVRG
ncbi:MAG: serine/threonine-protein phosphatase [Acidobacteriota bacterium]|nr:serine/threonine-protein phosphatase [Acidobacteriota bacterium]